MSEGGANTWVELDTGRLAANIHALSREIRPDAEIVFVVKANAYGHGMADVGRTAWSNGIRWFAVAHIGEALSLREVLPEAEILVVGAVDPAAARALAANRLIPVIVSRDHAFALDAALREGAASSPPLRCHAKVDTGMGRFGIHWEDAVGTLSHLKDHTSLRIDGICTHLAAAAKLECRSAHTQVDRFQQVLDACRKAGLTFRLRHIANTGGVLRNPEWDFDAVRVGLLLYGYGPKSLCGPAAGDVRRVDARPCLQWKTRIRQVKTVPEGFAVSYEGTYRCERPTQIATAEVGYSDGYSRRLSNRGEVLVGGCRCPVAGRVTMNFITIDIGAEADVSPGDEVVLIGRQGGESIWADELAERCDTICYEVLTSIRSADRRVMSSSSESPS